MEGVHKEMLTAALIQAVTLKEKIKELKRKGLGMSVETRFLLVCDALDDVNDIAIKLNTALR